MLSNILEPVYLTSIITGENKDVAEKIGWALCDRVKTAQLPDGYRLHKPLILTASKRMVKRDVWIDPCAHSLLWVADPHMKQPVVKIRNRNGLTLDGDKPLICKAEIMKRFMSVKTKLSNTDTIYCRVPLTYRKIKERASVYQNVKQSVHDAFQTAGFGHWVKTPEEIDNFSITGCT